VRKSDFKLLINRTFESIKALTSSKGEEYANNAADGNADQHANFKRQAEQLGMKPEQVLSVYMSKHLDAISSYIRTGREFSEPIDGRIDDAILYLILLKGLVTDSRRAAEVSPT
jgi:hypothetical protein